jgi:hypothetical protein
MNFRPLVSAASLITMTTLLLAPAAVATPITFNTSDPGTGFGGTSLTLNNTAGVAATLAFVPRGNTVTGTPSNVNLGTFTLACPTCTTQAGGMGSTFGAFTFDLVITSVTDGGVGIFKGTSTGGVIYSDVSAIGINWAPLQLGPGSSGASSGSFGNTIFSTTIFTGIVAPNSGAVPGQSTVQGFVSSSAVPEPATWGLLGMSLIAIGLFRRRATQA